MLEFFLLTGLFIPIEMTFILWTTGYRLNRQWESFLGITIVLWGIPRYINTRLFPKYCGTFSSSFPPIPITNLVSVCFECYPIKQIKIPFREDIKYKQNTSLKEFIFPLPHRFTCIPSYRARNVVCLIFSCIILATISLVAHVIVTIALIAICSMVLLPINFKDILWPFCSEFRPWYNCFNFLIST